MKVIKFESPRQAFVQLSNRGIPNLRTHADAQVDPTQKTEPPLIEKNVAQLTITKIIDFPVRKMVYVETVETAWPVVVWQNEEYKELGTYSAEDVYKKAEEVVAAMDEKAFSTLFDRYSRSELNEFAKNGEFIHKIRTETGIEKFHPMNFGIMPSYFTL